MVHVIRRLPGLGHKRKAEERRQQAELNHQKNWERKVEAEVRAELWGRKASKIESLNTPE